MKKMISWNVNGLRACVTKGFLDYFRAADADVFCVQETKLQEGQIELPLEGYHQYWNYAQKKGYSGTAVFVKEEPETVRYGIGQEAHDTEGRVITLENPEYDLVTCYTPNSQNEPDSSIPSVIFIPTGQESIPGGPTVLRPGKRMPGGASTISAFPGR